MLLLHLFLCCCALHIGLEKAGVRLLNTLVILLLSFRGHYSSVWITKASRFFSGHLGSVLCRMLFSVQLFGYNPGLAV